MPAGRCPPEVSSLRVSRPSRPPAPTDLPGHPADALQQILLPGQDRLQQLPMVREQILDVHARIRPGSEPPPTRSRSDRPGPAPSRSRPGTAPHHQRRAARNARGYDLPFDYLVVVTGSVSRTFPIPGLAQHAIGLKTVEEAVSLRNHVLWQLDKADSTTDPDARRKALTFVFVGGGFAGVEAVGEIEDMCRDAAENYRNIGREDMRFILVEAANRILPEMGPDLGVWTKEKLEQPGVEVYLETSMESCTDQQVLLKNGVETPASTIVWTAGVKPSPLLAGLGLPLGPCGHIDTAATLQVQGFDYVWSAGDNAQVPAQRPARVPPGQGARRQHHRPSARPAAEGVQARQPRCGRQHRRPQGRRDHVRQDQAQGPAGLVVPPPLPRRHDAHRKPQGPRLPGLDARHVHAPRDRRSAGRWPTRGTRSSTPPCPGRSRVAPIEPTGSRSSPARATRMA